MPLEIRIFIFATVETVSSPSLYFKRFSQSFVPLIRIDFYNHEFLGEITSSFMIKHHIQINRNMIFVQFVNHLFQFVFRAVLRPYRSFLFEFAQIIQIIGCISFILLFVGFIGRRNPYCGHTNIVKMRSVFL